jgi:hypothetical protein
MENMGFEGRATTCMAVDAGVSDEGGEIQMFF